MADNTFHNTVESLFKGMDSFITTKTVVGDAIHIGDTIILPLVDVSFGVAAGAFTSGKKNEEQTVKAEEDETARKKAEEKMGDILSESVSDKE